MEEHVRRILTATAAAAGVDPGPPVDPNGTAEHAVAWCLFILFVGCLLALDVTFLQTPLSTGRMSFQTAVKLTMFWLVMGLLFDLVVLGTLGVEASLGYLQGYMLEYMLSFDNLFVFHLVFAYYCTPEALLYRALYFGIAGAIVLRVLFFFIGYAFMSTGVYIVKFFFGAVLIWSGVRAANDLDDEETADPTNNRFIAWVTKHLPVSDNYEPHGHFFVTVAEVDLCPPGRSASGAWGDEEPSSFHEDQPSAISEVASTLPRLESFEGSSLLEPHRGFGGNSSRQSGGGLGGMDGGMAPDRNWLRAGSDSFEVTRKPARLRRKASLLLLVVVAVWVVDLVFAVDSVASKLASVSDIFLNCSSSAFAMLSLRSLYFVMESLVSMFQMLKYGIAAILVLIGLKLVFAGWLDVSNGVMFAVILSICSASIASSYWVPRFRDNCDRIDGPGGLGSIAEGREEDVESGPARFEHFERRQLSRDSEPILRNEESMPLDSGHDGLGEPGNDAAME